VHPRVGKSKKDKPLFGLSLYQLVGSSVKKAAEDDGCFSPFTDDGV
jgi:hypothetical protein